MLVTSYADLGHPLPRPAAIWPDGAVRLVCPGRERISSEARVADTLVRVILRQASWSTMNAHKVLPMETSSRVCDSACNELQPDSMNTIARAQVSTFMTKAELAAELRKSRRTIEVWTKAGYLSHIRI